MNRNKGIVVMLVGVGLFFISFFFSSGSRPKLDLIGNISRMEIVLVKGEYISGNELYSIRNYEGRVSIPLKYPLSLSVVLILVGIGTVAKKRSEKTP